MSDAPLLAKSRFGFTVGENVVFNSVGQFSRIIPIGVQMKFHGTNIVALPHEVRSAKVGSFMKKVLQLFCGYIDVWFLRETFVTDWAPDKELVKARIEEEANRLFQDLDMGEGWSRIHPVISWTFSLYLRLVLSPSVYMFQKHMRGVLVTMGSVLLLMLLYTIQGFTNFRSGDSDEEARARGEQAFGTVEHAPVTPLVLLLCTHLILMIFASEQLNTVCGSKRISFPLTFPVMIGKSFMVLRMLLAYSSKDLGLSIDYFVWQEFILIPVHACLAVFVGDPSHSHQSPLQTHGATPLSRVTTPPPAGPDIMYRKRLAWACAVVFGIDFFKTFVMFVFWYNFQSGPLAYYINRLPNIQVMLVASVLIHAVLDMIQAGITMFTMFIGKIYIAMTTDQSLVGEQVQDHSSTPEEQLAEKLVGTWHTSRGSIVTIQIKYWKIEIPQGLRRDNKFKFPTVYKVGVPVVDMEVHVPQGMQVGAQLYVSELRVTHPMWVHSVDAATLSPLSLHKLFPPRLQPAFTSAFFKDDDTTITFEGNPKYDWSRTAASEVWGLPTFMTNPLQLLWGTSDKPASMPKGST